jgi:hypothetical protein
MINLRRLESPGTFGRSSGRYRWVVVWLSVGSAIALLLLGNAVRDYRFVSRILAVQQVRHQMNQIAVQVEQQLRRTQETHGVLESALGGSLRGDESVSLLASDGTLLDHLGAATGSSSFSPEEVHGAFSRREPLFRTIATPASERVMEVFPMHPARRPGPGSPPLQGGGPPGPLLLEVALPLKDADTSVLGPIRRNLIVNLSAALALLATVLLAGVGLRAYVRGRRLEEQIEIARQVQSRLLPKSTLQLPGCEIATEYRPSEVVGGDFYDVLPGGEQSFAVLIGDVSGKGIPAALLMGVIHGAVRTAAWRSDVAQHQEESGRLNRLLCEHASGNRFASMFWCVYDQPQRLLRYVNAGHCPPFLIARRDPVPVPTRLDRGGPVLGLLGEAAYEASTIAVSPGDLLVMYSDGLVEASNAAGEEYGEERLMELLQQRAGQSPSQLRDAILDAWAAFASPDQPQDDLTIAIIRFAGAD